MRLVYCNERATPPMPARKVKEDLDFIKGLVVTVVAWSEITKWPYYRRLLRTVFGGRFRHLFMKDKNPFTVRQRWTVVAKDSVALTKGKAWIPQPRRVTNWMLIKRNHQEYIVVLSHFTNGAFKRKYLNRAARLKLWLIQFAKTRVLVKWLMMTYPGIPIIGVGDYNNADMEKFVPEQEWLAGLNNIVKAWVIDTDARVNVRAHMEKDVNTDHPLIVIDASYTN